MHEPIDYQRFTDAFYRLHPGTVIRLSATTAIVDLLHPHPFAVGDRLNYIQHDLASGDVASTVTAVEGRRVWITVEGDASDDNILLYSEYYPTFQGEVIERPCESMIRVRIPDGFDGTISIHHAHPLYQRDLLVEWAGGQRSAMRCKTKIESAWYNETKEFLLAGGSGDLLPAVGTAVTMRIQSRCLLAPARQAVTGPWTAEGDWSIRSFSDRKDSVRYLATSEANARLTLQEAVVKPDFAVCSAVLGRPGTIHRIHWGDYYVELIRGVARSSYYFQIRLFGPNGLIGGYAAHHDPGFYGDPFDFYDQEWKQSTHFFYCDPNVIGLAAWCEENDDTINLSILTAIPTDAVYGYSTGADGYWDYRNGTNCIGLRLGSVPAADFAGGAIALAGTPSTAIDNAELAFGNVASAAYYGGQGFHVGRLGPEGCGNAPRENNHVLRDDLPYHYNFEISGLTDYVDTHDTYTDTHYASRWNGRNGVAWRSFPIYRGLSDWNGSWSGNFQWYGPNESGSLWYWTNFDTPAHATGNRDQIVLSVQYADGRYSLRASVELHFDIHVDVPEGYGQDYDTTTDYLFTASADLGTTPPDLRSLTEIELTSAATQYGTLSLRIVPQFDMPLLTWTTPRWELDKPFPKTIAVSIGGLEDVVWEWTENYGGQTWTYTYTYRLSQLNADYAAEVSALGHYLFYRFSESYSQQDPNGGTVTTSRAVELLLTHATATATFSGEVPLEITTQYPAGNTSTWITKTAFSLTFEKACEEVIADLIAFVLDPVTCTYTDHKYDGWAVSQESKPLPSAMASLTAVPAG